MTSTTSHPAGQPAVTHRPFGIEHPYATSADQRRPVLPEAGQSVRLGVVCRPDVTAVTCEWQRVGEPASTLELRGFDLDTTDAAALAGGDGHLAGAQAAQLTSAGGWEVQSPALEAAARYRYRFVARTPVGAGAHGVQSHTTPWFDVSAGVWEPDGGLLTMTDRAVGRPADAPT
jgi:hypothetical protein